MSLMLETWKLTPPTVVISVTGDAAGNPDVPERMHTAFRTRLREVVLRTRAWIITGGTKAGVMKMVGEMVRETEDDIVCIGCATWGAIQHHERLCGQAADLEPQFFGGGLHKNTTQGVVEIDPNHTHLLLVDDGSKGEFGKEIGLRSDIEDKLCDRMARGTNEQQQANGSEDSLLQAVMVQLLVGGGPNSISTVQATLRKHRPVVVFADTGRSAAVIATAHAYAIDHPEVGMGPKAALLPSAEELGLRQPAEMRIWESHQREVCEVIQLGRATAKGSDKALLTFFSLDLDESEEDKLIEEAALSGCGDGYDRVLLAVKWGEPKVIIRHLDRAAATLDPTRDLPRIFREGLLTGKPDVVEALVNFGELIGCHPRSLCFRDLDRLFTLEHDRYELYYDLLPEALPAPTPGGPPGLASGRANSGLADKGDPWSFLTAMWPLVRLKMAGGGGQHQRCRERGLGGLP